MVLSPPGFGVPSSPIGSSLVVGAGVVVDDAGADVSDATDVVVLRIRASSSLPSSSSEHAPATLKPATTTSDAPIRNPRGMLTMPSGPGA